LAALARDPDRTLRLSFNKLAYFGRYGLSMKAINISVLGIVEKIQPSANFMMKKMLEYFNGGTSNDQGSDYYP
jgi:hypothetical protein